MPRAAYRSGSLARLPSTQIDANDRGRRSHDALAVGGQPLPQNAGARQVSVGRVRRRRLRTVVATLRNLVAASGQLLLATNTLAEARSQTARARVPVDEVVSGIDARRAPTGISGRRCQSASGVGRRIGRWVAGSGLRHSVRLESACYETPVGPRVIQRSSAIGLAERATAASSARLCLGGSMTSRQATTVAMSSRRPRRQ